MFHNLVPLLMQQPMVMSAQQHQIIEPRLATIAPMLYMVRIHVAGFTTTWKAAALIANLQSPAD